jgi:hypothetical protein
LKDKSQQTSKYDPIHTANKIILGDDSEAFDVLWHILDHLVGVVGISQHRTLLLIGIEQQEEEGLPHNEARQYVCSIVLPI